MDCWHVLQDFTSVNLLCYLSVSLDKALLTGFYALNDHCESSIDISPPPTQRRDDQGRETVSETCKQL